MSKFIIGKKCFITKHNIVLTNIGTGTGYIKSTLPFTSLNYGFLIGREDVITGLLILGKVEVSTSYCEISKYDYTTILINGRTTRITGEYEI